MTDRAVVHLVPHTHWDREWYEPFQTFRMRLVELIDQLLERMEADPRLRFTLDGQVATVDDYLEIRAEAEPLIRRLIGEGRLAIGPWQILMDEFLVSGETIVRNLEFGWSRAEELGRAMPVGYLPDMFGHVAQMPQILHRAGLGQAVVWRGVPAAIDQNRFRWVAPDGSEVMAEYLVGGYGNGAYLFDVPAELGPKVIGYQAANAGFYGRGSVLAMYGTDHAVPTPRLADLVEEVSRDHPSVEVRLETLADYLARPEIDDRAIPSWTGELRSGARANMLMGVSSARGDLKAACARTERLLERYAEPLASIHGGPWPARLLELAWRRVVDNSAHDSICGCSHDVVVAQVLTRFAEAEQIARGILAGTVRRIATGVPLDAWAVINPSPTDRTDLVTLDVVVDERRPPSFSMAGSALPAQELSRRDPAIATFRLRGDAIPELLRRRRHGRELLGKQLNGIRIDRHAASPTITLQVDDVADPPELDIDALVEAIEAAASEAPAALWEVQVVAPDRRLMLVRAPAPALGWSVLKQARGADATGPDVAPVTVTGRSLANGLVEISVEADGSLVARGGGTTLRGVGRLVDGGDYGDSYNYAPPRHDRLVETPTEVAVEMGHRGPLLGELVVRRWYDWPTEVLADGSARADTTIRTEVATHLELRADEPFVRVRIAFENHSRDHRLRWQIPLPGATSHSAAEGQFAVVERGLTMEGGHGERPLPTYPARGFVHAAGVSVLLDQVTEYELVNGGRELAITVLRSFGLISRNENPYREDPAGPQIPVPDAQRIGPCGFGFAIFPHARGWSEDGVLAATERYQLPFVSAPGQWRSEAAQPEASAGLSLRGAGVVLTALRRRGNWLELRVVAEHPVSTAAIIRGPFREASTVDLIGREGTALPCRDGTVEVPLGPWEIATIRLR